MKNYCVDNIREWPCSMYAVKPEMLIGAHYPKRTGSVHSAKLLMDISSLKVAFTFIIKHCWMMKSYFEDNFKSEVLPMYHYPNQSTPLCE